MTEADNRARAVLMGELQPGERLLWCGMPRQGYRLRPGDTALSVVGFILGVAAVLGEYPALSMLNMPMPIHIAILDILIVIFLILAALSGAHLIFGRFIADVARRKHTFYGVTDRRVLIIHGILSKRIKHVRFNSPDEITLLERENGSGDLIFGSFRQTGVRWQGAAWPGIENMVAPTFESIPGVHEVFSLIEQTHGNGQTH